MSSCSFVSESSPRYTDAAWRNPECLAARRWKFTPGAPQVTLAAHAVGEAEPRVVACDAMAGSRTARFVCSWRASAHALGFGPDSLAHLFIDDAAKRRLAPASKRFRDTGCLPIVVLSGSRDAVVALQESRRGDEVDMLSFIQVRTCFLDDTVTQFARDSSAAAAASCHVVLLGAGFDTRPYRLPLPPCVRCWEVDAPETQASKRAALKSAAGVAAVGWPAGTRVTFVPHDLSSASLLLPRLHGLGMDPSSPVLFVCEGVLPYLEPAASEALLREVGGLAAGPAAIAFDVVTPGFKAAHPVRAGLARAKEPWLFDVDVADVRRLCESVGLTVIDELSVAEGLSRYLPVDADGRSVGFGSSVPRFLVAANVPFIEAWTAQVTAAAPPPT